MCVQSDTAAPCACIDNVGLKIILPALADCSGRRLAGIICSGDS